MEVAQPGAKASLESLSKEEIINKYKGLLGIAKKAKQAKDEISEENRKLKEQIVQYETQKEADKKALITMKELIESYTENKLQLTTQLSDLQKQRQLDLENMEKLSIEKESLTRQITRLSDDNDTLLSKLEMVEKELQQEKQNVSLTKEQDIKKILEDNEDLAKTLNELKEKYSFLKEVNTEQRHKFNSLKDRFIDVHKKLKKLKECKKILLETQHEYADSVTQWQMEIIRASKLLCKELNELRVENVRLQKRFKSDFGHLQFEKLCELLKICDKVKFEYDKLKEENINLKKKQPLVCNNMSPTMKGSNEQIHRIWELSKVSLKEFKEMQEKCEQLKREKSVLEFGSYHSNDIINKLENLKQIADKAISEYNHKSQELSALRNEFEALKTLKTAELNNHKSSSEDFQKLYAAKEKEHREVLDEMRELNEALKARGDCISKLQMELKNQEDKFQMLQHQLGCANTNVEESHRKVEALQSADNENKEKMRNLNIELEALKKTQAEIDNQSEILSTSTISRAEELQRNKDIEDSFEDKYNKIRSLASKLKKKLQEEISDKQELEKELNSFRACGTQLDEMDTLKKQLMEKQTQIDSLKTENQKLKSSRKQANVLNLEIEAAEKSLTDVTNKLAARSTELEAAQLMLKTKDTALQQLRKEIDFLEASKLAETKHSQDLRNQIDHLQKSLKDAVHSKQQAFDKSKILEQDVENLKIDLEGVRHEMATASASLKQTLDEVQTEKLQLLQQLSDKQATLSEYEHRLKQAERAAEDLKLEYLDYKVKAQAVLRKNQNRDSGKERELEEELMAMKTSEVQLKASIETLTTKLASETKSKEILTVDNESLQYRSKELMQLITELRFQNDALQQEMQSHMQQQHETLKQHRQQIEALDKCHKEQLQSISSQHQRQLEQLRKEYTTSMSNARLPPMTATGTSTRSLQHSNELDYQSKLDFLLMEREDAEGSEEANEPTLAALSASRKISNASSSSNTKRSHHDFMPLDELLNTPINAISCETLITTPLQVDDKDLNMNAPSELLQMELNSTKERLHKQESRVRHLTALLAENEQDLAKLTQMNDMLKEELRRQERSTEREKHMHNSEYIKNVIMKFLTLSNADEKTRLVPVLNTILKLSRSETEILNCVAKGQKDPLQQKGNSWGNFLPWSGNGGGGGNINKN